MRKLIAILFVGLVGMLGTSPASAATPEECAESDNAPPDCPVDGDNYPLVLPEEGTIPEPEPTIPPTVPVVLPTTGSSGVTGVLQVGALFLTGGLIVAVAARRRKPDEPIPA